MKDDLAAKKDSMRRMILALDAMNCETALIEAAAAIAAKLQAELDALFVEDTDLYTVADLPITQEISLSSARPREISGRQVEQALRSLSREAASRFESVVRRSRIKGKFHIMRGERGQALSDACDRVDLLFLQPSQTTVLRVRITQTRPPRVFAICGDSAASRRTLDVAAQLAMQDGHVLELITLGEADEGPLAALQRHGLIVHHHQAATGAGLADALSEVENRPGNTLLIPSDLPVMGNRAQLLEGLAKLRCQILLVN
jgi:hypothetical protein